MRIASVALIALLLFGAPDSVAGVGFKSDTGVCNIEINGAISSADVDAFKSIVAAYRCKGRSVFVSLNSPGGDVDAGIQLGKYIRELRAWTGVAEDNSCASSCVLVLLGGIGRHPWGSIGLHRPYSEQLNVSSADAAATFRRINALVSSYLSQMNIPVRLLDEMNAVSPGDVRWISDSEKVSLHIEGNDPFEDDVIASANAKRLDISKQEYYKRFKLSEDVCGSLPNDGTAGACIDAVMKTGKAPQ